MKWEELKPRTDGKGFWIFLAIIGVALIGVLLFTRLTDNGSPEPVVRGDQNTQEASGCLDEATRESVPCPTTPLEPTASPILKLWHDFQTGDVVTNVFYEDDLCEQEGVSENGEPRLYCEDFNIRLYDVMRITGEAVYIPTYQSWYWPVLILQGGKYTEGLDWWVPDRVGLNKTTWPKERRVPDYSPGEVVLVSYGFWLRESPNGPVLSDYTGEEILVGRGNDFQNSAVVLDLPTLGPDGHYWCRIQMQETLLTGFVPCELQKQ